MLSARSVAVVAAVAAVAACQPRVEVAPDRSSLESAVRARSHALVAAEQQRDLVGVMRFYAPDAVLHIEGMPPAEGHAAIRQLYQEFFGTPLLSFEGTIARVEVAASGDLAYELGMNEFVFEEDGEQVHSTGKYMSVWRKRAGGDWMIVAVAVTNNEGM